VTEVSHMFLLKMPVLTLKRACRLQQRVLTQQVEHIACLEEAAQQDQAAVDSLKKLPNDAVDVMKNLSSRSPSMNGLIQNALLEPS
jgi:hypothetical protein